MARLTKKPTPKKKDSGASANDLKSMAERAIKASAQYKKPVEAAIKGAATPVMGIMKVLDTGRDPVQRFLSKNVTQRMAKAAGVTYRPELDMLRPTDEGGGFGENKPYFVKGLLPGGEKPAIDVGDLGRFVYDVAASPSSYVGGLGASTTRPVLKAGIAKVVEKTVAKELVESVGKELAEKAGREAAERVAAPVAGKTLLKGEDFTRPATVSTMRKRAAEEGVKLKGELGGGIGLVSPIGKNLSNKAIVPGSVTSKITSPLSQTITRSKNVDSVLTKFNIGRKAQLAGYEGVIATQLARQAKQEGENIKHTLVDNLGDAQKQFGTDEVGQEKLARALVTREYDELNDKQILAAEKIAEWIDNIGDTLTQEGIIENARGGYLPLYLSDKAQRMAGKTVPGRFGSTATTIRHRQLTADWEGTVREMNEQAAKDPLYKEIYYDADGNRTEEALFDTDIYKTLQRYAGQVGRQISGSHHVKAMQEANLPMHNTLTETAAGLKVAHLKAAGFNDSNEAIAAAARKEVDNPKLIALEKDAPDTWRQLMDVASKRHAEVHEVIAKKALRTRIGFKHAKSWEDPDLFTNPKTSPLMRQHSARISAYREGLDEAENSAAHQRLLHDLRSNGYAPVEANVGGRMEWLVPGMAPEPATEFATKYGQDSFVLPHTGRVYLDGTYEPIEALLPGEEAGDELTEFLINKKVQRFGAEYGDRQAWDGKTPRLIEAGVDKLENQIANKRAAIEATKTWQPSAVRALDKIAKEREALLATRIGKLEGAVRKPIIMREERKGLMREITRNEQLLATKGKLPRELGKNKTQLRAETSTLKAKVAALDADIEKADAKVKQTAALVKKTDKSVRTAYDNIEKVRQQKAAEIAKKLEADEAKLEARTQTMKNFAEGKTPEGEPWPLRGDPKSPGPHFRADNENYGQIQGTIFPALNGNYAPVDLAKEYMDNFSTPQNFESALGSWNKFLGMWRRNLTVLWPSFHTRNGLGGWTNNYVGGVRNSQYIEGLNILRADDPERVWKKYNGKTTAQLQEEMHNAGIGVGHGHIVNEYGSPRLPGSNKVMAAAQALPTAGRSVAANMEDLMRAAAYLRGIEKFGPDGQDLARDFMLKRHGDYGADTALDTKMKAIVPFWRWTRTNIPFQIESMVSAPGKYQKYQRLFENIGDEAPNDFEEPNNPAEDTRGAIRMNGNVIYPDLPLTDINQLGIPHLINKTLAGGAVSYASNKDLVSGRELRARVVPTGAQKLLLAPFRAPGVKELFKDEFGVAPGGEWTVSERLIRLAMGFPNVGARGFSTIDALAGNRMHTAGQPEPEPESLTRRAVNFVGPFGVQTPNPELARNIASGKLSDILRRIPKEGFEVPKEEKKKTSKNGRLG